MHAHTITTQTNIGVDERGYETEEYLYCDENVGANGKDGGFVQSPTWASDEEESSDDETEHTLQFCRVAACKTHRPSCYFNSTNPVPRSCDYPTFELWEEAFDLWSSAPSVRCEVCLAHLDGIQTSASLAAHAALEIHEHELASQAAQADDDYNGKDEEFDGESSEEY